MTTSGYSGTPLPRKLGIRAGDRVAIVNDPGQAAELIVPLPDGAALHRGLEEAEIVVFFTTNRAELVERIGALGRAIFPDGSCWIAWPKQASKVPTDMTENAVREVALPLGLVDTKVCAIDETWSGLRLVWRRERR